MHPDLLDQLFDLYVRTFPANERRTETSLRQSFNTGASRAITRQENDTLIAFAIIFTPANERFALLEYIAVEAAHRSQGIGAELFAEVILIARDRTVIVETDSETGDLMTGRRQAFYHRLGCRRVEGLQYQLPLPGNPPPMDLLIHGELPRSDELIRWLQRIYVEVYGCTADDPRIGEMMGFIDK